MDDIFDKFYKNVTEYNLIKPKDNIVAGISGGIDSVVLLDLLARLRDLFDYNLYVAHVNHGVRGIEADRDEKFVERLSNKYSVPFYSTKVDMNGFAKEKKISSEEAGRILRYGFFRKILNEVGGGKIAVAHNKNDQAETVMLRIIRGTGIDGLKGMQFKAQDIIRPILNIKRNELNEYLMSYGLDHVEDYTNVETIYQRNRVRLELFPYIEENFNPNIVDSLYRLSKNAQIDSDALDEIAEKKYNLLVKKTDNNSIIIEGVLLNKELPAIKNRIIRKAIFCLCDDIVDIEQKHVELIIELLENNKTGKSIDIAKGIIARISYGNLYLELEKPREIVFEPKKLTMGENIIEELRLKLTIEEIDKKDIKFNNLNTKYFDYDKIEWPIILRTRKEGDVFYPLGLGGKKTVKKYFIDKKIPQEERGKIPLVCDINNIMWIIGYDISDIFKITNKTQRVLKMRYQKY